MGENEGENGPPPPARGWYTDPQDPEYQRFWSGQAWTTRRYWGSLTPAGATGAPTPAPPPGAPMRTGTEAAPPLPPPAFESRAPIPQSRFIGPPLNPRGRSSAAFVAVAVVAIAAFYVSRRIFPWQILAFFFVLGLLNYVIVWPARRRFLNDPARVAAISEPVMFQAQVWVRFIYAPSRWWITTQLGRWDLGVRTDSFQITNWVHGSRNRARSTFFHAAECVMWQDQDRIVVSGPTYIRSKVEFAFSAEGQNAAAWNALALSGVRALSSPPDATTSAGPSAPPPSAAAPPPPPPPPSPMAQGPPAAPSSAPTRGFRRLGHDLGSSRASAGAVPAQAQADPSTTRMSLPQAPATPGRTGRGMGKPPVPATRSPVFIAVMVVGAIAFLSIPFLLNLATRGTVTASSSAVTEATTTLCELNSTRTQVEWSGTVTVTRIVPATDRQLLPIAVLLQDGAVLTQTAMPIYAPHAGTNDVGPLYIPVPGAPTAVSCRLTVP